MSTTPRESIHAELPACPECGSKDRKLKVQKSHRTFGPDDDYKVQYVAAVPASRPGERSAAKFRRVGGRRITRQGEGWVKSLQRLAPGPSGGRARVFAK